ncbi:MAG: beta-ketoacyl synthase N-terminal-like domain-containing protein, partial [Myxococcota bacterium]
MNEDPTQATPLAIVGIGCLFPKAGDVGAYWANLRDGVDAITGVPASHWSPEDYYDEDPAAADRVYARRGGFLDPVDVSPLDLGIAPRDLEATDTTQLLALHVAAAALRDAGYGPTGKAFDRDRAAVILGVTGALELVIPLGARLGHPIWRRALKGAGVDDDTAQEVVERIAEQYVPWQENSFPGLLGNVAAGRIANRLDLHGTNCVVDAACASSLSALHLAGLELQAGRADLVLAGGVDTFNDVFMYTCFSKTPALSKRGDARPFDRDADGTMLGEGVGIVALKTLASARRDGDRVYAVIRGIGSSSDGKGQAIYAPSSEGQARALRNAYTLAGVDPTTVELIEGHGTGTKVGDATEVGGLTAVFDPDGSATEPWCAVGSVKSMIGHTKAAAGIAGLIKTAMALHHRVLPPTLKVEAPNEALDGEATPFTVNASKRPWFSMDGTPRRAGVSAFGFGGSNFHAVLEEGDREAAAISWDGRTQILAFTGADRGALARALRAFDAAQSWAGIRRAASRLRADFDGGAACRATVIVREGDEDLATRLQAAAKGVDGNARSRWSLPDGTAFGEGPPPGKLAGLFPGQGAQAVAMLDGLACQSVLFQDTVAEVLAGHPEVVGAIYPRHAFDAETREAQRARLTHTATAQPALGAVSLAAWRVLESFGLSLEAAVGHSYGELTALCATGRIGASALGELSRRRGALMAEGVGDRGSMLAVFTTAEALQRELDRRGWSTLTIANYNAPEQQVLSGPTGAIDVAQRELEAAGLRTHRLAVSAAFHSPLVAEAHAPFAQSVRDVALEPSPIPVFANASGAPYPEGDEAAQQLLADQLVSPVRFAACIDAMVADGVATFVELGPGRRLSGLVTAIAGDAVRVTSVDESSGRRHGMVDLARCLGAIAAWGHDVRLDVWDPYVEAAPMKKTLTVSVCGANLKPKPTTRPPRTPMSHERPSTNVPAAPPVAAAAAPSPAPAVDLATLQATQANLAALMRLQEQTAELHRRFLEGQQHATQAFGALVAQQQSMLGAPGAALPTLAAMPAVAPVQPPVPAVAMPPGGLLAPAIQPAAPVQAPVAAPPVA